MALMLRKIDYIDGAVIDMYVLDVSEIKSLLVSEYSFFAGNFFTKIYFNTLRKGKVRDNEDLGQKVL